MIKKEVKNKNKKKNGANEVVKAEKKSKVNKKLLVIISLVVVIMGIVGVFLVSYFSDVKKTKIAESEPIISTLEDGTYYMTGVPLNNYFEIETKKEFSYEILDEEDKKIDIIEEKREGKLIIKPNINGWDQGKTYTLKITNGKFVNSELANASVVVFSTIRESSQSYKYNDNVEIVNKEKVKINDNNVKTNKNLKAGEILVVENDEKVVEAAYKITKVNGNDTYDVEVPTLEEVFSELDYYSMEYLDLSGIEVNKELSAYLGNIAKKSVINSLMLDVEAAAKLNVSYPKYNKKTKEVVFGISMDTDPGDKIFNKSFLKHHKFSTAYEVGIKVKAYNDLNFPHGWDTGVEFEIRQTIKSGLETNSPTLDKAKNNFSDFVKGKTGVNWLSDELYKIKKDDYGFDKEFGELSVPTSIPFVEVLFTTNMLMDFEIKGNIGADLTNTTKASFGYSTKNKFYANATTSNKMSASAMAEGKTRLGITAKAGIEIINIVNLVGTGSTGAYGDYKLSANSEVTTDKIVNTLEAKLEAGVFVEIGAEVNIAEKKYKFKGWSKEWPKVTASVPYKAEFEIKAEPTSKEDVAKEEKQEDSTPSSTPEVYYDVALYVHGCGDCISPACHRKTFKVKSGSTVRNYFDQHASEFANICIRDMWWEDVPGDYVPVTKYSTVSYLVNRKAELERLSDSCFNSCDANYGVDWDLPEDTKNQKYACYESCREQDAYKQLSYFPDILTGDYSIDSAVTSNTSIVIPVCGCGSAGVEDE